MTDRRTVEEEECAVIAARRRGRGVCRQEQQAGNAPPKEREGGQGGWVCVHDGGGKVAKTQGGRGERPCHLLQRRAVGRRPAPADQPLISRHGHPPLNTVTHWQDQPAAGAFCRRCSCCADEATEEATGGETDARFWISSFRKYPQ